MGARPRFALLACAFPENDPDWLAAFADGFFALGDRHGVDLVGGDTTRGPLNICVQIMGEVPRGKALRRDGARVTGIAGGSRFDASAVYAGETLHLFGTDGHWQLGYAPPLAHAGDADDTGGSLAAPMPGKVIALIVEAGATVRRGQPLLVMEAMKMEHTIAAPADGVVEALLYRVGDQVAEGAALVGFAASVPAPA
jgi:acetyl/propionyl-CoA carboxylase alpha subunit